MRIQISGEIPLISPFVSIRLMADHDLSVDNSGGTICANSVACVALDEPETYSESLCVTRSQRGGIKPGF